MPRLDNSIDIKAPVDQVFAYVSDVTTHPEWVKWTKEAEVTSVEDKGLGTTSAEVMQVGPKKENVETLTTEYREGEFVTRRHTRGMEMTDRLSVLPFDDGTKVAWSIDYSPPMGSMGKLMDMLFMERLFDQLMKDSLNNLKERLESLGSRFVTYVDEYDEDQLEPLPVDGMEIPLLRLTLGEPTPYHQVKVGEQAYEYTKSYPIKGHSATLPKFVREQMSAGRKPLVIERPTRYLVYLNI